MSVKVVRDKLSQSIGLLNECFRLLNAALDEPAPAESMVISEINTDAAEILINEGTYDKEMTSKKEWHEKFVRMSEAALKTKDQERLLLLTGLKRMIEDAISVMESNKNA